MTMCIGIREETRLQDGIGRGFDTGNQVRGRESRLFDFGEVIDGVLVKGHFTESAEWDFALGPDFGQIKDVPAEFLGLFRCQDLHVTSPRGEVARLDLLKEILSGVIGILSGHLAGGIIVEDFDSLVDLEVELDIDK